MKMQARPLPSPPPRSANMAALENISSFWFPMWGRVLLVLFLWGLKEAVTRLAFSCPCFIDQSSTDDIANVNTRIAYGSLFIAVPELVFWLIGEYTLYSTMNTVLNGLGEYTYFYGIQNLVL